MSRISHSSTVSRYSPTAIFLHWVVAALIGVAWLLPQLTDIVPGKEARIIIELHRSLGMTVLGIVFLRAVWRFVSPPPALPIETPDAIRWASHLGHGALYLLMIAVPVLGMLYTWAAGRDLSFWGLFVIPAPFAQNDALRGVFIDLHALTANAIMALAGLHAAAALFHQYVLKDGLLERMLPARSKTSRHTDALV
ncbi:MAG TPA: cytochrome b [Candidatus Cybelea sp.]|nr:cytochrome b [Candidatus Cybelea sp.]